MEDLVPSGAYDLDETGYWKRMPLVVGMLSGILLGACISLPFLLGQSPSYVVFLFSFLTMSAAGSFALRKMLMALRRRVSPSVEAIYGDYSAVAGAADSNEKVRYRLACVWMKPDGTEVPGVLYLGEEGLLFVPHRQGQTGTQPQKPLRLGPIGVLHLALTEPQYTFWHRLLYERLPKFIDVRMRGQSYQFAVPTAEVTLGKIERSLNRLENGAVYPLVEQSRIPPSAHADIDSLRFDERGRTPLERVINDSEP
jgi:hypothetical protein